MQDLLKSLSKTHITPDIYKSLPEGPGIYVFFQDETPIYIGKAINLKRRVSSYFDLDLAPKTARMVSLANFLSYIRVESEFESLLLEAKLIRKYMPHYNVLAKDDKHPLYIQITKETYPRVITARKASENDSNIAFFGPFPSSKDVYNILRWIRRIFPYSDHKLGKRACLYSHIGLCNPCPNEIKTDVERAIYLKNIKHIRAVFSGKFSSLKNELNKEMELLSKNQKFEEAAEVRNKVRNLAYITSPQMPTDYYIENPNLYEDIRSKELKDLGKLTNIKNLHRIECFDNAHLAGTNATASMVVFIDGEAEKSEYRHFKIRQKNGQSDYDSMREIAQRRANHFEDWGKPDLIIVDGGKGQLSSFVINAPIVGIAKHPDRLIVGENKIKLEGPVLNLVQRMRDEAHRFARRYHHHLISNIYKHEDNT